MSKEYQVTVSVMFRITAKNEEEARERAEEVNNGVNVNSTAKYLDQDSITAEVEGVEEDEA